ncbi:hypothetical protein QBC41DRAFT_362173 [Cercophora samala]|uniref:DNA mismatch repair protein S5 domain-containing protein n=1 Tax=Cercophora samala TaxID=330535 RepID=A0AA39ZL89_9PEZI|nr:hypothetical protein QBC41DRAFT_362173 [Cercophora samala]
MSITSLPDDTSRRIGSALNITSTVMVLKELLDNALDSGAQAVHITVSPNTVDKIEVRDNGSGISSADFDALGRHSHTSKLSSFEDISKICDKSLGFRGTALASINSLSTVHVVTRAGTETPRKIWLADKGGVQAQSVHAAEQGTTVTVTNIFSNYPIRERIAKRPVEISKSIEKMRHLVHAYAFARHPLRIHFTVLQHPNHSIRISPHPEKDIMETAIQTFGVLKASQCFVRVWPDRANPSITPVGEEGDRRYLFEAILMKPDAEPSRLPKGLFFSVDSRPISATRGIGKKLSAVLRECLKKCVCPLTLAGVPKDIFIRLNIRCGLGWYDVNIEPYKEDVLFLQEDRLVTDFETFLTTVYPRGVKDPMASAADDEKQGGGNMGEVLQACQNLEDRLGQEGEHRPDETNSLSNADYHKQHGPAKIQSFHRPQSKVRDDDNVITSVDHDHDDLLDAKSWTVDMSAPVDESDDDTISEGRNESGVPLCSTLEEERSVGIRDLENDGQRVESQITTRYDTLAELNPWSIAAMGSLKRRRLPPPSLDRQQFPGGRLTPSKTPPSAEAMDVLGSDELHRREIPVLRPNPRIKLPITPLTPSPPSDSGELVSSSLGQNCGSTRYPAVYKDRPLSHPMYPRGPRAPGTYIAGNPSNAAQVLEVPLGEMPFLPHATRKTPSRLIRNPERQQTLRHDREAREISTGNIVPASAHPMEHNSSDSDATTELNSSETTDSEDEPAMSGQMTSHSGAQWRSTGGDIKKRFEKRYSSAKQTDGHLTQAMLPFKKDKSRIGSHSNSSIDHAAGLAIRPQHNGPMTVTRASASDSFNDTKIQQSHRGSDEADSLQRLADPMSEQMVGHADPHDGREKRDARMRRPHFGASNHNTERHPHNRGELQPGQNTRSWLLLGTSGYEIHAPRVIINALPPTIFRQVRAQPFPVGLHAVSVGQRLRKPFSEWDTVTLAKLKKLLRILAPATEWTLRPKDAEDRREMTHIGKQWAKGMGLELQS